MPKWNRGRVIGRGSTATVHLASSSGELYFAVKTADLSSSALLRHEQSIHSFVAPSPHLISYLGFDVTGEPSGTFYNLFLEYAPGGSLSDEIRRSPGGKQGETEIRSRTRDILSGLAHLHSEGIVHCDVKGQNVLIGCDGRAKIADLGCAKFAQDDDGGGNGINRRRRPIMGTPMHMAPEVARGEEQGMAADVWAVGCTVIEMATGGSPWPDASEAVSLLHRIGFSDDTPSVPAWISDEGKDFLSKCLRRNAKERWTADELLKHPFLSNCKGRSPRSTLDQSFWDSASEVDGDDDGGEGKRIDSEEDNPNAIDELLDCGVGSPNWTWDNGWVTVRIGGDELMEPAGTGWESVAAGTASSTISTGINDEEFTFNANHAETRDLPPVSDNHYHCSGLDTDDCVKNSTISCDNCSSAVTMPWLLNWILAFAVNSCHSCCRCVLFAGDLLHVKIFNLISRCRPLRRTQQGNRE